MLILFACCCFLAGCTTRTPRGLIEKHLGVSAEGTKVLYEAISERNQAPDVSLLLHNLAELGQDRNLTLGMFLMKNDPDLMVEILFANDEPIDLFRSALSNNMTSAGSTLVLPEDISNINIETNLNGRVIGTFDWIAPKIMKGTCRFVIRGNQLEYLGFLRKDALGTYDCETIFSRYGNMFASRHYLQTNYFVVIVPTSDKAKQLNRKEQITSLNELIKSHDLDVRQHPVRDKALPLIFSGERKDRERFVEMLSNSDDWNVAMSGRAAVDIMEEPMNRVIEKQIWELEN
jgi:hypothetical protein